MNFLENLDLFSIEKKEQETITKTKKVRKVCEGAVTIWWLKEKYSGIAFVNPNISALKYGRDMEIGAANTFAEHIENYHQDCIISEYELILDETVPWIGASLINVMFVM